MKITLNNSGTLTTLDTIMTGSVRDGINGEYTIDFTIIGQEAFLINDNTTVQYDGQYFNVINYSSGEYGIQPTCNVKCEHVSYTLNEAIGNGIDYTGTPIGLLDLILQGTQFTVGEIESDQPIATSIHGNTYRRTVLNNLAGTIGCEIEYDGYNINLRQHRGSVSYVELLDTKNVIDVSKIRDVLKDLTTYNVTLGRRTILKAGDNIHIKYDPLHLDDYTRIIAIDYNPYDPFEVSIDVGDYTPDILDELNAAEQAATEANEIANQANDTANQVYDVANQANEIAIEAAEKVESFDERINDAQNDVAEMKLEVGLFEVRLAHTENDINGIPSTIEAVIRSEITDSTGSIKLFVEGKDYLTQPQADGSYLKISNLNAGISTYINGATGKAEVVSACSSTYQKIADMSGYVTNATLNTSIGQYIDSQAGTAKIISACSATYQTIANMSGYVTNTTLNTSIEQYVDSTAGTAKIISACSATYQTKDAMSDYITNVTLDASIGQYVDSAAGTAKVVQAVSATYQTKAAMSSYATSASVTTEITDKIASITLAVSTTTSSNQTTSTITMKSGSTTIDSVAVMGTTATQAATIAASAVNGITLSATNGTTSSTLTLKSGSTTLSSQSITFTGIVTFSDLSAASTSTIINGANIRTGTISADRIDANSLKVQTIYKPDGRIAMTSNSSTVFVGGDLTSSYGDVYLRASNSVRFGYASGFGDSNNLIVNVNGNTMYSTYSYWSVGTSSYRFGYGYFNLLYANTIDGAVIRNAPTINGYTIAEIMSPSKVAYSASYYVEMYSYSVFRPNSNNSIDCGDTSYRWKTIYTTNIDASGTLTAYTANLGGNSSYYIVANTSRELRPYNTSSSYPCYLGTSSYPWHYAYIGSSAALIGTSTSSSLGFFGKSPVSRPSVAAVSTGGTLANAITGINNVITALKNLGLIA